ncbi:hypothetical protein R1sor_008440 [Riccia sorocarpa]|uniref:ribonuclease H n=1 Tax=Riccia sorocarpa TaxID=122646 RepID=A0ABD3HZN3_9MARC
MSYYAVARGHCPGVYLTWEQTKAQGCEFWAYSPPPIPPIPAYYAVAKGRVPGIYSTWLEAEIQVKDMYSAKYKKFYTREEAVEFIEDYKKLKAVDPNDPHPRNPSTLVAFCDGSAINNGKWGCRAGWATVFPHNPSWNCAGVLLGTNVSGGKPTNNRAEYRGAIEAILRANQEDPSKKDPLYIYSDSMLLVRSMTEWVPGWKDQGWIKADGNPVLNQDLLKWLLQEQGPRKIIWKHVRAHTNGTDWWSVWNQKADELAGEQTRDRSFRNTSDDASGRKRSLEQIGSRGGRNWSGKRPVIGVGGFFQARRDHNTATRIPC